MAILAAPASDLLWRRWGCFKVDPKAKTGDTIQGLLGALDFPFWHILSRANVRPPGSNLLLRIQIDQTCQP